MRSRAVVIVATAVGLLLAACAPAQAPTPTPTTLPTPAAAQASSSGGGGSGAGNSLEAICQKSQPGKGPSVVINAGEGRDVYLGDILQPYAFAITDGRLLATPESVDCRFAVPYTLPNGAIRALAAINHSAYYPAALVGINADQGSPDFGARLWAVFHEGHFVNAAQLPGTNLLVFAALNNGAFLKMSPGAPYVPELGVIQDNGMATAGFMSRAVVFREGQARIDSVSPQGVITYTLTTPLDKAGTQHTTTVSELAREPVNVPLLP